MGRQLPWAQGPNTGSVKPVSVQQHVTVKSVQNVEEHSKEQHSSKSEEQSTREPSTPNSRHMRVTSRSPSISPPPGPPPISPLRPGYDNDDLYIMVEDEFWSVAQSYTAHLHHAEYKRLMRKAKEARPREVADLSPSKPRVARDRVRRDALREKQHSALDEMVGKQSSTLNGQDGNAAQRKNADPWRGTSLAKLMRDNEQTKTSLVGLERLPSSTRAAKGYGQCNVDSAPTALRNDSFDALDMMTRPRRARNGYDDTIDMDRSLAVDDDEEDVWGRQRKIEMKKARFYADTTDPGDNFGTSTSPRRRDQKVNSAVSVEHKPKRSYLDDLEDGLRDHPLDAPSTTSTSHKANTVEKSTSPKRLKDAKQDRRSRLDEVPFFMF